MNYWTLVLGLFITLITSFILTPFIKKIAEKYNIVDVPDHRKVHSGKKPYLGGIAIFLSFIIGYLIIMPDHDHKLAILIGAVIILLTGLFDDLFDLKPIYKLIGQTVAAVIIIQSGLLIDKVTIPFAGTVHLDNFSIIITLLWIIGVTNAINLIDGLDGLATGVSTIALFSIMLTAILDYRLAVALLCVLLIGSNLGFLYYNFYPAKIFLGDAGALFLGYMIAVISMLGLFKNIAIFSFIIPLIILAVPIFDTVFAIFRRLKKGQSIMSADRKHIHYQLIDKGFSHRGAVLLIYGLSLLLGLLAVSLNYSSALKSSIVLFILVLLIIHIIAEMVGLVMNGKQPVLNLCKKLFIKNSKQDEQKEGPS